MSRDYIKSLERRIEQLENNNRILTETNYFYKDSLYDNLTHYVYDVMYFSRNQRMFGDSHWGCRELVIEEVQHTLMLLEGAKITGLHIICSRLYRNMERNSLAWEISLKRKTCKTYKWKVTYLSLRGTEVACNNTVLL